MAKPACEASTAANKDSLNLLALPSSPCGLAWRAAQCGAGRKKKRPAKKRVGTLKKKRKAPCVLQDHRGQWQWERRARSCISGGSYHERVEICYCAISEEPVDISKGRCST